LANVAAPFFEYDPVKNTWQRRGFEQGVGHDKNAVIDPKRRKLVVGGGGEIFVYDLRNFSRKSGATGETSIHSARYPGLAYDPVSDRIIAWNGGADVYVLDVDTMVWTKRVSSGRVVPTAATPNGTFGRWQYIPSKNALTASMRVSTFTG